ncbi:MAG: hypothetical protein A2498_07645 [Lentisphaerae bacterium RIFOXYC12_FULL_60_16]|nr:MAG: hypothetical protein A2498_07645 [Lentisphaerae bacterium RIFOXYC12_FULL_60_16]OGV72429.1 MAG: hypothetical protein A2269_09295 [Lentisphaerae bacterium RIFOXYA12_FULL_60_10]OGV83536.1 MAG: hypothetical protein A2340_10515 [Lentisphaerae bacterium RIFOXYB12_FULL_60_10]
MNILVTGGAGYIGTLLVPMLLEAGHKVILLDNFMWGVKPVLGFVHHPNLTLVAGDIRDERITAPAVRQADAILHLAAIVGYPACAGDEHLAQTVNIDGTRLICKLTGANQMLVFASTGSTYGQVEGIANETTPINPLTLYGRTKREGETMVLDKGGICLRFATVFGISPRLRLDLLVNDFCYQACHNGVIILFEGHHRRTFLHARDAARVYLLALDRYADMKGGIFNVGSSTMNYTKLDIAREIRKVRKFYLHEAAVGEDLDKRDYEVCYNKIASMGFSATVSLADGISELLKIVPYIHVQNEWRNA